MALAQRQLVDTADVDKVFGVDVAQAVVRAYSETRHIRSTIVADVVIKQIACISQALRECVVREKAEAVREAVLRIQLQRVVVVLAGASNKGTAGREVREECVGLQIGRRRQDRG